MAAEWESPSLLFQEVWSTLLECCLLGGSSQLRQVIAEGFVHWGLPAVAPAVLRRFERSGLQIPVHMEVSGTR